MNILTEITKEVFESCVPVAKMPERNSSVYERMTRMFSVSWASVVSNILSPSHESHIDSDASLKDECVRLVCLDTFIRTCRSLDVVLTATGFGIVSTESTAPASKLRVDAVVEEMMIERLLAIDNILSKLIRVKDWGATEQARLRISTLFYRPEHLRLFSSLPLTSVNWQLAINRSIVASVHLRREISAEYMDELLSKVRTGSLGNADIIVVDKCLRFIGDYISQGESAVPNKVMLEAIVEQLECYEESYPTYRLSRLYATRHGKRYENKRDDPTFFFI